MIVDAESRTDSDLPTFARTVFTPWSGLVLSAHWTTHQYRVAVREAAEGLTVHWKERPAGTMSMTRSSGSRRYRWRSEPGKPAHLAGGSDDKTVKSMRGGLVPGAKAPSTPWPLV